MNAPLIQVEPDYLALFTADPSEIGRLIAERRDSGADHFDEVWDGVYVMSPWPNDEHQEFAIQFGTLLQIEVKWKGLGEVRLGGNISDRPDDWTHNFRVPDVFVYLKGTSAENRGSHWFGGPDFAVEILSPGDRAREKFDFYAKVGVRELLLVDREPWALELYRLTEGQLTLAGKATLDAPELLASQVLPLSFRLVAGTTRPFVELARPDGSLVGRA